VVTPAVDGHYIKVLLDPLALCAAYRPAFGQEGDAGIDLPQFRILYGDDPLYHWVGLDSDLMYAAHKAAGGMTSIYRQLGIGCERLLRRIIQDCLGLSDSQVAWSYEYDKGNGQLEVHSLDVRIVADHIVDLKARRRVRSWTRRSASKLGLSDSVAEGLVGAVFEIRQGYKSADSKRQQADLRFGLRAYGDANLLPVIAIVSTQASDAVCRRYTDSRLLVLRGHLDGDASTLAFFRNVVGYDLAAFFQRNTKTIRLEFSAIIEKLLNPRV
jgi:hypothetical protein